MTSSHNPNHYKHFKARLFVFSIMLITGFIGLLIMDLHHKLFWPYIQITSALFAILSIWLYWYLDRNSDSHMITTIWHQVLHWIGLLILIYLATFFVSTGVMGTTQAGLMCISLLALSVFLAGVYTDPIFLLIGITLGIFAAGAAMVQAYLSVIMIPVIIVVALIIYVILHIQRKRAE
ncbi:MAG: hypothetical protein CL816_08690 [Coxiellaceae bacterium]|nr:hypothetical protein [Coxiellaceae bacterium]